MSMTTSSLIIGCIFLTLSVLALIIGGLATAQKLPGNPIFGIRVAEVRANRSTWDKAHQIAGPFWLISGVALGFAGLIAFRTSSWGWIIPIALVLAALFFFGVGANAGARRAANIDVVKKVEDAQPAPKPEVDLGALRRAASAADKTKDS